jgi:hypothetical protein
VPLMSLLELTEAAALGPLAQALTLALGLTLPGALALLLL